MIEGILFRTWPAILVMLVVAYFLTKLNFSASYKAFVIVFFIFLFALGIWLNKTYVKKKSIDMWSWKGLGYLFFAPIIATYVYIFFMGVFLADVEIATDKEFYKRDEAIMVSISSGGYIFRPSISRVECGAFEATDVGDTTMSIPPDKHLGTNYILVDFEPQGIPLKLIKTHELRVAREEIKGR